MTVSYNHKVVRDYVKGLESSIRRYQQKYLFWSVVHNARDLIVFFAVLPVTPILAIIQAIRGDD